MGIRLGIVALCFSAGLSSAPAYAQDGAAVFRSYCASCHEALARMLIPVLLAVMSSPN